MTADKLFRSRVFRCQTSQSAVRVDFKDLAYFNDTERLGHVLLAPRVSVVTAEANTSLFCYIRDVFVIRAGLSHN